jgi:hypothetical protein
MIPNVTMRWCQKKAKCKWCGQDIEPGSRMIAAFFWNKGSERRTWNIQLCFHQQCWMDKGNDYLDRNPYVPHRSTGRKRLELTPEARQTRYLVTRRYNALLQRLRKLDDGAEPIKALRIENLMAELVLEMVPVGGVPKTWIARL